MSSNPQVLIADDATFIRDLIKKTVRSDFPKCEIFEATDGKKALSILKKTKVDFILCDWEMPEMSGDEVLTWVRSQPEFEKTPFVMVTSRGDKEHIAEAAQLGVTDYLVKPFKSDQLINKITKALKRCGKLADARGKKNIGVQTGFAADTADILTSAFGGSSASITTSAPPPQKTAPKAPKAPKAAHQNPKEMLRATLRFHDMGLECLIEQLTTKIITMLTKRKENINPTLFEPVVIDLVNPSNANDLARINAYIFKLEIVEDTIDAKFIRIAIRIVDDDNEKSQFLNRLMHTKAE